MTRKTVSRSQLRKDFKDATEEVVDEADFVTEEEVRDLVDQHLEEKMPEDPDEDGDDEDNREMDEEIPGETHEKDDRYTTEELRENLPEDIWEEVKEYLSEPESAFSKAVRAATGQGPSIPTVESDEPSAEETATAALSRFEHHDDGSPGGE